MALPAAQGAADNEEGGGAIVSCSYMEVYNESIFDLLQPFKVGLRPQPHASAPPSTAPASL